MQNIKQRLTNLKRKINEVLPEGNEILNFSGITKQLVVESVQDTYNTLDLLTEFENKFEGILIQRRVADCIDKANSYLKEKFKEQDPDEFNKFLNKIAEMHYAVKETFIIFTKEPIRLDISLNKAKILLEELENQNIQIQPLIEKFTKTFDSVTSTANDLAKSNETITKTLQESITTANSVNTLKKKAETAANSIIKSDEQIQLIKSEVSKYQASIIDFDNKLQTTFEQLISNKTEFEKSHSSLNQSIAKNIEQQNIIQETIENANRLGMAASFKKRKDELEKPYWAWGIATILTITLLIITSTNIFYLLKGKEIKFEDVYIRLPIFIAFVWLGWFCAKQFGFVSRIREDYSYKYAVSMAFEGYKNATKEINEEMLEHLLALTLQNISTSPLNIFETKTNHGTPFNEILSGWNKNKKEKQSNSNNKKQEDKNEDVDDGE